MKVRRKMAYPAYGMLTYQEIADSFGCTRQNIDCILRLAARKLWRMGISKRVQDAAMLQVTLRQRR